MLVLYLVCLSLNAIFAKPMLGSCDPPHADSAGTRGTAKYPNSTQVHHGLQSPPPQSLQSDRTLQGVLRELQRLKEVHASQERELKERFPAL